MNPLVTLIFADPTERNLEWTHTKYTKPAKQPTPVPTPSRPQGQTIAKSTLAKLKQIKKPDKKKIFDAIAAGESFADVGDRDASLQAACSSLCWADEGKTSTEGLLAWLRPSLQIWADEPGSEKSVEEELEKAREKIERARGEFGAFKTKQMAGLEGLRKVLVSGSDPDFKQLALQQDNTYYIYCFEEERYWPAHTNREFMTVIRDAWPPGCPVELSYMNEKGDMKKKPMAMLMEEYGTVIREVIYSMSETSALYSPETRVLRVPATPRRPLKPVYHAQIEEWLALLPKNKKHLPMLLDWIATSMLLDRMSAALYLSGPAGTGKSLLSTGLARLWSGGGPSKLEHVFARFNATLTKSPLVVLDESWKGDQNINLCARLRELVGNMSHQIEPKGKPVVTIEGGVRLLITTNNETTLNVRGNGDQNQMEREATIERILHIPTSSAASKYIVKVKDRDTWRTENKIAEHALWLRDQRAEAVIARARDEGHRFLIQGDKSDAEFYDGIGSRPKDHDAALQWLSCLFTRAPLPGVRDRVLIEHGKFRVVPRALCESWESYGLSKLFDTPTSSHRAKGILKPFLESDNRVKLNGANAYKINVERFVRIALEEGLIPVGVLNEKLGLDID